MRRYLSVVAVLLCWGAAAHGHGLLIPEDKSLPPLAMLNHKVHITIDDQIEIDPRSIGEPASFSRVLAPVGGHPSQPAIGAGFGNDVFR